MSWCGSCWSMLLAALTAHAQTATRADQMPDWKTTNERALMLRTAGKWQFKEYQRFEFSMNDLMQVWILCGVRDGWDGCCARNVCVCMRARDSRTEGRACSQKVGFTSTLTSPSDFIAALLPLCVLEACMGT
eukprot:364814-Chlamydomonas_euryale.AAC.15